ncbi:MAG: Na/Pi cotransporter family protein, partial [Kiritimatiellae bacterium]|nr:Na/Pi cotransporter family protein [Kiritimatiellia bacterium]
MNAQTAATVFSGIVGGVGIFLVGMKFLSEGMQALAGPRLARFVNAVAGNRFRAALAGVAVTLAFQSSSATTVMAVGFVDAGAMSLLSALGVAVGSHVGTTLSLWVLALDVAKFGLPLVGLSAFLYIFAKKTRPHETGRALLGLGMLLYGMQLMGAGFAPLRDAEGVRAFLARCDASTTAGFAAAALAGTLATAVIQSSAAMVVIVMGLFSAGVVDFPTSVALVLGSNVGTTATALLASAGGSRRAV